MRKLGAVVIATMVLAWLTLAALPARAETFVDVQSFVNSLGNTVTVTDTYEINGTDVVLVSRDMTEVRPDGAVLVTKSWDFYPSGAVRSSDEYRNSTVAPTNIHREYSEAGTLLFQRGEMSLNGEVALVSLITYNADGYLLTQEERRLTTLADGTQVWEVTVSGYALNGTVASQTVTQYPSGYNFDAPPAAEPPADQPPADQVPVIDQPPADQPPADQPPAEQSPADEPSVDQPPADDPPADTSNSRPGWGHGDDNHEHSGPAGKNKNRNRNDDRHDDGDDDRDDNSNDDRDDDSDDDRDDGSDDKDGESDDD